MTHGSTIDSNSRNHRYLERNHVPPIRFIAAICLVALSMLLAPVASVDAIVAVDSANGQRAQFCSRPQLPERDLNTPFNVRLALSARTVILGEALRLRVENFGARAISYGLAYTLARREGERWVHLPVGPFYSPRLVLSPHTAGECQSVQLPQGGKAGTYRIAKSVRSPSTSSGASVTKRITFRVALAPR